MKIEYPVEYLQLAIDIARLRSRFSGNVYALGTDKHRGDGEDRISWLGVMGELIGNLACVRFKEEGVIESFTSAPLLAYTPQPGPDMTIKYISWDKYCYIDVKCTEKSAFNINEHSHNRDDGIDTYMLIHIDGRWDKKHSTYIPVSQQASFEIVSHNDVNLWEVKTGFNNYYSRAVQNGHKDSSS